MKKLFIISLLLFSPIAYASEFHYLDPNAWNPPSRIGRFFSKLWECKWHISCYQKLGAFTTLSTSDTISGFPATYNANLVKTVEVGTTSVASITTLSGLVSVGTLTTGSLGSGFTTVVVGRGGTGSTTLSANRILLGNGTGAIGIVDGLGSSGQFLQSQGAGAAPAWAASSFNEGGNYTLTASNTISGSPFGITAATTTFFSATTTFATTSLTRWPYFAIGTSSRQSIIPGGGLVVGTSTYIGGGLGVGVATTSGNVEILNNLLVSGTLITSSTSPIGVTGYQRIEFSENGPTTAAAEVTRDSNCPAGSKIVGGGGSNNDAGGEVFLQDSFAVDDDSWRTTHVCYGGSGGCAANTVISYGVCLK